MICKCFSFYEGLQRKRERKHSWDNIFQSVLIQLCEVVQIPLECSSVLVHEEQVFATNKGSWQQSCALVLIFEKKIPKKFVIAVSPQSEAFRIIHLLWFFATGQWL